MKSRLLTIFLATGTIMFTLASCKSYSEQDAERLETPVRGYINISADETFKPVIDEQVKVFNANNPDATVNVFYKPESECLKDLANDSVRMVIATRKYSKAEEKFIIDSAHATPSWNVVAHDAIAVIVHPSSPDSMFTMAQIRALLEGNAGSKLVPVFDGAQATSTVRYIVDSVLRGAPLSKNAMAAKSSQEVLDYVSRSPNAVGFIGVGWIGNHEDPEQVSFLKKVKVAWIESATEPGSYVSPVQVNIYEKSYPMVRDLVYVLKEKVHLGLGYGFARFLEQRTGQLIFKRAYLAPALENFILRPIQLNEQ
ncbi:MAG: phosphate ABC transporter substrate-binding protein, PhoT family [Chitinophagaceae bacterium]|nr:MAG: phosphate ABC transporter substrate-binding protein, PhoT family [Chitinophagaceae bacterium]